MVQNNQERPPVVDAVPAPSDENWDQSGGIWGPSDSITHYRLYGRESEPFIILGSEERPHAGPMYVADLLRHLDQPFRVLRPAGGWRSAASFVGAEKAKLRPIAETLAMLDGNAFFGATHDGLEHWAFYLPQAHVLFTSNGGWRGWGGHSFFDDGGEAVHDEDERAKPASELNLLARAEAAEARLAVALEALEKVRTGDVPRPVAKVWRADGTPSKHDQCKHSVPMHADCEVCVSDFIGQALGRGDGSK